MCIKSVHQSGVRSRLLWQALYSKMVKLKLRIILKLFLLAFVAHTILILGIVNLYEPGTTVCFQTSCWILAVIDLPFVLLSTPFQAFFEGMIVNESITLGSFIFGGIGWGIIANLFHKFYNRKK